ncbi:MAG: PilZ domain-containing protein [Pseudomonadota bacterium]
MSHAAHVAPSDPLAPRVSLDRRIHRRVKIDLIGRFMRADRSEFNCRLNDISVGGAAMFAPVELTPGEHIIAYFEHIGRIEGPVFRKFSDGFAMTINASPRRREKLAAQLTWLINRDSLEGIEERRPGHDRLVLDAEPSQVTLANGEVAACTVLDISISGASVTCHARPARGDIIRLGTIRGRVVRHHADGFAIEFVDVQRPTGLRSGFRG